MEIDRLISSLHPLERKILPYISKEASLPEIIKKSGMQEAEASKAIQMLAEKGLVSIEESISEKIVLGQNGKTYIKEKLPERRFLEALKKEMALDEVAKAAKLEKQEVSICLGTLKKKMAINFQNGKASITENGKKLIAKEWLEEKFLKQLPKETKDFSDEDKFAYNELIKRKDIITKETSKAWKIMPTELGKKIRPDMLSHDYIDAVTPEMLKSKQWKNKKFRRYTIAPMAKQYPSRQHPLNAVIEMIREIFVEMGFQEMEGPWVETSFWCLDSMWIPQDHPAREVQDTFYLPYKGELPDKKLVDKVIACHEHGGKTGSKGYGYKWDPEMAKQLLLRTHTTATTFRQFGKGIKAPAKYFYISRVFRNEAIDATHLPEFHQVEGFVMADGLTLQHLMGFIKEFYSKMGIKKIRFKPTYNPYTEPSMEALYYDEKRQKWIELINSGIFRPEALEPYGITKPVIAWGLGVERLAMIIYESEKLKDILGASVNIDWMKSYKMPYRKD